MRHWKIFLPLVLLLCACGTRETPAPAEGTAWGDIRWEERLGLSYAQHFAVDFSPEGYAKIVIDQETYLLTPEDCQIPAELPEDVTVLRQPLENIYLQATSAMDCFRRPLRHPGGELVYPRGPAGYGGGADGLRRQVQRPGL